MVASLAGVAVFGGAIWLAGCNSASPSGAEASASKPSATIASAGDPKAVPDKSPKTQAVDIAICLDTSSSMDGLIDSAKQKLWAIVNELAVAKPRPVLRVALYQYGNSGLKSADGWIQQLCPLTDDLDAVYSKLFALKTNGGEEYVSRVCLVASDQLDWSKDKDALKMIVVAGNEPATQDKANPLKETCQKIIARGIIVNTIFCGQETEGRNTGWSDVAAWADGRFAAIDQDKGTVAVVTPYDKKLAELGSDLNATYIAYGSDGTARAASQAAQDTNANSVSAPAAAERAVAKASSVYVNSTWDLGDASQQKDFKLADVPATALPAEMQNMSVEQREKYVAEKMAKRGEIQKEIQELNKQRGEFIQAEVAKQGLDQTKSLDYNLRQAVRAQAQAKGFAFEK